MVITIRNWEIYNPKRDQTTYTWLRLQNDIVNSKDLFGLSPEQKWVWVCILCEASKKNSGQVEFDIEWLSDQTKAKESAINDMLARLEKRGVISIALPPTTADYTALPPTTPTNERTNERTEDCAAVEKPTTPPATIAPLLDGTFSPSAEQFLRSTPIAAQESWLAAYEDPDWIRQEVNKAAAWIIANPKKKPKKFAGFFNNWLSRGWEDHRKTIASNKPIAQAPPVRRVPEPSPFNPEAKELAKKFAHLAGPSRSSA